MEASSLDAEGGVIRGLSRPQAPPVHGSLEQVKLPFRLHFFICQIRGFLLHTLLLLVIHPALSKNNVLCLWEADIPGNVCRNTQESIEGAVVIVKCMLTFRVCRTF